MRTVITSHQSITYSVLESLSLTTLLSHSNCVLNRDENRNNKSSYSTVLIRFVLSSHFTSHRNQNYLRTMELKENKPIKIKNDYVGEKSRTEITIIKDEQMKKGTTEKPERVYYLWFMFLKLLLEMEKNGMEFTKGNSPKGLKIGKDIKIDKKFYKDWDIESVRSLPFWKWWKTHKHLFGNPKTVDVNNLKEWKTKSEPHYRYLRIDTRKGYSTIMKDVRNSLDDLKVTKGVLSKKVSKYHINGSPQYDNDILRYNIMVRTLNGEDLIDIFQKERKRLKKNEKSDKGGEEIGDEKTGKGKKTSKIWIKEDWWKKNQLRKGERKFRLDRTPDDQMDEERRIRQGTKIITEDLKSEMEFRSELKTEFRRYVKETQRILKGVSQGEYRKTLSL